MFLLIKMTKAFVKKIPGREIEVETYVNWYDNEWEIQLKGPEAEKARKAGQISDVVCKMWEKDNDPEGKHAKEVHNKAVILLESGTNIKKTVLEVEAMISTLADKIYS